MKNLGGLFFWLLFILNNCSDGFIKNAKNLESFSPKEQAILIFSVSFPENKNQELPLFISLVGDEGGSKEIRLDPGEDEIFVYIVREGFYKLKNMGGENNSPKITKAQSSRDRKEVYTDKEWGFFVKAGTTHYAGNFFIREFSGNNDLNTKFNIKMDVPTFSVQIEIRKRMSDIMRAVENNPYLKDSKYPLEIRLIEEVILNKDPFIASVKDRKNMSKREGFGAYYWGSLIEDVKTALQMANKKVMVISQDQLIDNTNEKNPIEFLFIQVENKQVLFKVVLHLEKDSYAKTLSSMNEKYGEYSRQEENSVVWFTPNTKIILSQKDKEILLMYEEVAKQIEKKTNK